MNRVVDVVVFSSTAGCSDPAADGAAIRRLSARSSQESRWQPDGRGSAEGGHHRLPVVEEALLVVEVDAHPELPGARLRGPPIFATHSSTVPAIANRSVR